MGSPHHVGTFEDGVSQTLRRFRKKRSRLLLAGVLFIVSESGQGA
jgi:hypothetical protein